MTAATRPRRWSPCLRSPPNPPLYRGSRQRARIERRASGRSLIYRWYKASSAISGATTAAYSIAAASSSDQAAYHVMVSISGGWIGERPFGLVNPLGAVVGRLAPPAAEVLWQARAASLVTAALLCLAALRPRTPSAARAETPSGMCA